MANMGEETIDIALFVDTDKLNEDGVTLTTNASNIYGTIGEISDMLSDANWTTWLGVDSDGYVAALLNFLSELEKFTSETMDIGTFMKNAASNYDETVVTCVEEMTSDE